MAKTMIVLLISGYSITRLLVGAYQVYMETLRLPIWVLGVTAFCCFWVLVAGVGFLFGRLKNRTLHLVLLLVALGSAVNLTGLIYNPVNNLTVYDLILTGTFFDIFFFLGALTIPLGGTARSHGRGRSPLAGAEENFSGDLLPGEAPLGELAQVAQAGLNTSQ